MSLSIIFSLDLQDGEPPSGFDLGHIEVTDGKRYWSSRYKTPDQAMMIFPSIVNLLDGLRALLQGENQSEFVWIGIDSSFSIAFVESDDNKISVFVEDDLVINASSFQIARQIYQAVNAFLDQNLNLLQSGDPSLLDVQTAVEDFLPVLNSLKPRLPYEQDINSKKGELP